MTGDHKIWLVRRGKPPNFWVHQNNTIPTKKSVLFKVAAEELPWQVTPSGWAAISSADIKNFKTTGHEREKKILAAIERVTGAMQHSNLSDSGWVLAATDPELEAAINAAKGLNAHAAADRSPKQTGEKPEGDNRISGAEALNASTEKGPGVIR